MVKPTVNEDFVTHPRLQTTLAMSRQKLLSRSLPCPRKAGRLPAYPGHSSPGPICRTNLPEGIATKAIRSGTEFPAKAASVPSSDKTARFFIDLSQPSFGKVLPRSVVFVTFKSFSSEYTRFLKF